MDNSGSAFPIPIPAPNGEMFQDGHGLTIRQWYAGMALQGIVSRECYNSEWEQQYVKWAFSHADAMLEQGEK
jgi:hypothetical protein